MLARHRHFHLRRVLAAFSMLPKAPPRFLASGRTGEAPSHPKQQPPEQKHDQWITNNDAKQLEKWRQRPVWASESCAPCKGQNYKRFPNEEQDIAKSPDVTQNIIVFRAGQTRVGCITVWQRTLAFLSGAALLFGFLIFPFDLPYLTPRRRPIL